LRSLRLDLSVTIDLISSLLWFALGCILLVLWRRRRRFLLTYGFQFLLFAAAAAWFVPFFQICHSARERKEWEYREDLLRKFAFFACRPRVAFYSLLLSLFQVIFLFACCCPPHFD
jgi:hypothetical protein